MKQILIVDDDIHIGNMLEETLKKEGYGVSRAYSSTEALYVLSGAKPDLILLDLMLPGLNGEEILPQMKGIPVIVVSARVDIDNKVDLLLGGAADYVTKPFHMKELLARISVQLRKPAGLGLAIARNLVEQMGGNISAEYDKGRLSIWIFFREINNA